MRVRLAGEGACPGVGTTVRAPGATESGKPGPFGLKKRVMDTAG